MPNNLCNWYSRGFCVSFIEHFLFINNYIDILINQIFIEAVTLDNVVPVNQLNIDTYLILSTCEESMNKLYNFYKPVFLQGISLIIHLD